MPRSRVGVCAYLMLLLEMGACDSGHGSAAPDARAPVGTTGTHDSGTHDSGAAAHTTSRADSGARIPNPPREGHDAGHRHAAADAGQRRAVADASSNQNDTGVVDTSWLIQSGDSVFFIGNSFFGDVDSRLYDQVASLGQAMQPPFIIQTSGFSVYGNNPLSWFYQQPESQAAINSGTYTMFVIQGEDREPVDHPETFKQAVRDYHQAIGAAGARMMLFMTWSWVWEDGTDFLENLSRTYDEIGQELGIPVIPVGLIYDDSNTHPYSGEQPYWLTSQGLHQNTYGEVVNTYATFAMLTGINPMGRHIPMFDAGNDIPDSLYGYLSQIAWARVAPRLGR